MTPSDALVAEELIKEAVAIEEKRAAKAELQAKAAAKLADSLEVEVESGQVTDDCFCSSNILKYIYFDYFTGRVRPGIYLLLG